MSDGPQSPSLKDLPKVQPDLKSELESFKPDSMKKADTQEKGVLPSAEVIAQEKGHQQLVAGIESFDTSKLKPTETQEKNPLPTQEDGDFHEFLNNHIEAVRQGKLIDQVGRHSSNLHTEIPTASAWFQVINPLYDHFVNIQVGSTFEKLTAACAMFASQARGPATDRWLTSLQEECDEVWASGRQVCEAPSLTGKPCIQPQHRTHPDQSGSLPVLPHSSGYRMVSACNCGSKQGNRDDPFDVKSANFTFYYYMNEECCHRFQAVNFPVFQPGSTTARPAPVRKNVKDMDFVQCTQELSLEASEDLSLSQSDYSLNDEDDLSSSEMESPTEFLPDTTVQVDTAEYLVGMPHTLSSSALPLYPSWSLLCRGPSSLYSHSVGLAQMPGFGSGAVHLTVWEVTLQLSPAGATVAEEWRIKKGSGKPLRRNKDGSAEMTTKIFLGTEYECPRGHRFLLPLPAAPRTGKTHLYPHTDTPLYLPCPCRPNNQLCAQLMRVHVVTPRTPFSVYLHPKVRPAPLTCPVFTTGIKEPLELTPSSYWVLRLPWAYENGPDEIYTPPMKSPLASYGVLLTEWIGVRENATGELKK
nr:EOG090X02WG [Triops cancriformis]